jgi:hypothetical protein
MFDDVAGTNFSQPLMDDISNFLGLLNRFDAVPKLQKLLDQDVYAYLENAEEVRRGIGEKPPAE